MQTDETKIKNGGKLESGVPQLPHYKIFCLLVFGAFHTVSL